MTRVPTPRDSELLKALRELLGRLVELQMSEPDDDDKVTSDLRHHIRDRIAQIEKYGSDTSAAD